MYSVVKKCDRCGKIVAEDKYNFEKAPCKIPGYSISVNGFSNHEAEFTYELCESCATDFLDWVTAKNTEQPVDPHEKKESDDSHTIPDKPTYKLKKGTHTYHRWTEEEDDFILNHSAGLSCSQLAYKFGTSIDAVCSHKSKLLNGFARARSGDKDVLGFATDIINRKI